MCCSSPLYRELSPLLTPVFTSCDLCAPPCACPSSPCACPCTDSYSKPASSLSTTCLTGFISSSERLHILSPGLEGPYLSPLSIRMPTVPLDWFQAQPHQDIGPHNLSPHGICDFRPPRKESPGCYLSSLSRDHEITGLVGASLVHQLGTLQFESTQQS